MTKTQIQVPEELFRDLKAFAKRREWSLAETFRRGAELLLEVYPADITPATKAWHPPKSKEVGWKGLNAEELRDIAFEDAEPRWS
ncbi:antitoxin [Phragmitibacter flavus]|uniref:Antitoxin n=1 Tax=Phragmitibacter flavus TaxID=2576071 RepID=A0A5R8K963_9BACT|nr:antitoxin [Phragmitibacter flavus]TLD68848.1 antitoxin [Phragmitibacter flavus]